MPTIAPITRRTLLTTLGLGTAGIALAGCGTTDPATDPAATAASTAAATGPVTVTDGTGEQVTLPAAAVAPAGLEWGQTEMLVTLGVQPVAVADIDGYNAWVSSAPLTDSPTDVGLRQEPSVESVAGAAPDVLIGVIGSIPEGAQEQMAQIAPVLLQSGGNAADQKGELEANFRAIAAAVGRDEEAEAVLADLDQTIAEAKGRLETAGKGGANYVFAYPYVQGNQVSFRMHGATSEPGAYAALLGLTEAWGGTVDESWGLGDADLEALTDLPDDTHFLYWANETEDPIPTLEANPLWTALPFVQAGNVYAAADKVWVYGGPASMKQWVTQVADIIAG